MTNFFYISNYGAAFNSGLKVTFRPLASSLVLFEQACFFSTEKINKVPDYKNSIKYQESLVKYNSILNGLRPEFKQWLVGFLDAEGSFMIIPRRPNNRISLKIEIGLHIDDLPLLKIIQTKLNCGIIFEGKSRSICKFTINNQSDLKNIILPVLEEFPLNTTKYLNYLDFKEALNMVDRKEHLTTNGKLQILNLKANMNRSRTNYEMPSDHIIRITPEWLLGFIEGDGSFTTTKLMPFLSIAQSIRDYAVLKKISDYFSSGTLQEQKITNRYKDEQPMVRLIFQDIRLLHNTLLPLFDSLEFYSKKQLDYKDWIIIVKLYYSGIHLYPQGEKLINDLKMNMNNYRLSSYKNVNDKPIITQEMINEVLSLEPLYSSLKATFNSKKRSLLSTILILLTIFFIDNNILLLEDFLYYNYFHQYYFHLIQYWV